MFVVEVDCEVSCWFRDPSAAEGRLRPAEKEEEKKKGNG